ncbi:protein PAT1 homolog 2 [Narcine bancroftii]|uniref:protein PAT1 homolog 2 n=1 Tax=Narcine bancroftii TaxID=1343680 RepID=UPI0038318CDD
MESAGSRRPEEFQILDAEDYLQEMQEEEDIDLYNEETFGIEPETTTDLPEDLYLLCEALGACSPECADKPEQQEGPEPAHLNPPPEQQEGRRLAQELVRLVEPTAAQELSDPAVMKAVHGPPSLESLDNAIVDRGVCSVWDEFSISQVLDPASVDHGCSQRNVGSSPQVPRYTSSAGGPRPSLAQRRIPLDHRQLRVSTGSVQALPFRPLSPMHPVRKLMPMRFGSPAPSASFSPSPNLVEAFRFPQHVTQFHPQHRRILNQRQRTRHSPSNKETSVAVDAYAKLMTDKEKAWVIKLQMIQLQSENPHLDDYYYQEFFRKLELKLTDEELGVKVKREPQKLITPYVQKAETYDSVLHIEGSLGQVAVSTCYSPRRAIDVVHVSTLEEDSNNSGQPRLRLLNNIEKMYQMLLEMEEMEGHLLSMPEEKHTAYCASRDNKLCHVYELLHAEGQGEGCEFWAMLRVRKGMKLLPRLLPLLPPAQCVQVLVSIAAFLRTMWNEDVDEALSFLFQPLMVVVHSLSFSQLISVLQVLTGARANPQSSLQPIIQNKFSISFLYALLSQGELLLSLGCPMDPCIGDFEKWTDTIFLVARELSLTPKSSVAEPLHLPSNLLALFCRYVDKQTAHKLEDKIE